MAASPLLALPVEILTGILVDLLESRTTLTRTEAASPMLPFYLPARGATWQSTLPNYAPLGAISRTCTKLRDIALPLLYQRVNVAVYRSVAFIHLLRHFSRFPEYASLVKELVMFNETSFAHELSTRQISFLFDEAGRRGIQMLATEVDEVGPIASVLLALLLRQTPNIHTLGVRTPAIQEPDGAIDYATRLPDSYMLDSLRHLEIRPRTRELPMLGEPLTALLRHTPALARLRVGHCAEGCPAIVQSPLPQLKDLHLFDISPEHLVNIAKHCPQLERCHLGLEATAFTPASLLTQESCATSLFPDTQLGNPYFPPFTVGHVLTALLPLRTTLGEFYLDWNTIQFPGKRSPTIQDLDLLTHFRALRCLRLALGRWPDGDTAGFIAGLPNGIESLSLGGQHLPIRDLANQLLKQIRAGRLSKLKSFRYTRSIHNLSWMQPDKAAMILEGTGVDCRVNGPW